METKWDIKKIAKHFSRRGRRLPDRRLIHPKREWLIGLGLFLLLALAGALFEIRSFDYYRNLEDNLVVDEVKPVTYKEGEAARVLERYQKKKTEFNSILEQSVGIVPVPISNINQTRDTSASESATGEVDPASFNAVPTLN